MAESLRNHPLLGNHMRTVYPFGGGDMLVEDGLACWRAKFRFGSAITPRLWVFKALFISRCRCVSLADFLGLHNKTLAKI